jgi:very-short-patch-repair endonuclease
MNSDKIRDLVDARWPSIPVASTQQLATAGLEERVLTAAVRSGVIVRLRRGAYVRSGQWNDSKPWARDVLRIQAHYESTGGLSRYSHVSAARLYRCQVWGVGPQVHVTTGHANSSKSAGSDVRTHRMGFDAGDLASLRTVDGRLFKVTSLERTVLDCARLLTLEQAAVIGDHALRKGAGLDRMRQLLALSPVKRGGRRALNLLDALDGRSESAGETRTRLLLQSLGMHSFVPQVEIPTGSGLFRTDFADSVTRIVIEFDGRSKYFDYKPTDGVLLAERQREIALVEEGWLVLRLKWKDLDRPAELRRRLLAMAQRSRRLSA